MVAFILTQSNPQINSMIGLDNSENKLLERLRGESIPAFNQLYKMYAPNLFGVILKIVNQQETAEDLLQEVFLKIKKHLPSYDQNKSRLFTWMFNIARNSAVDHLRLKSSRQQASNVIFEDAEGELKSHSHSFNTDTIGLKKLIDGLTVKQRNILDLAYYKGYTHYEIADLLQMPIGSVKSAIRQAILKLRLEFGIS